MYPFVETIRISDGKILNLPYHEERLNNTRKELFGITERICLATELAAITLPQSGVWKCRVLYREQIITIGMEPYTTPVIRNLMMIEDNTIDYAYKSTDREQLQRLKQAAKGCSDVLIVRDGLVTDTSFCNVALFDGYHWITPLNPLLKGTMRAKLIECEMLIERNIPASMIPEFQIIMLFNALNEFGTLMLPVHEIYACREE